MKKITTILMLLMLSMGVWAQDYTGIQLTFNKNGTGDSPTQNVTVAVADQDGNPLSSVTASVVETNFTAFQTSGFIAAVNNDTGFAFTPKPNTGYSNAVDGIISYTFKIEGLPANFAFNTAVLKYYGINAQGRGQDASNNAEFSIDMQTGAEQNNLSSFASLAGSTFFYRVTTSDLGTLYTERTLRSSASVPSADALYVKITLTKTAGGGCFPGLGKIQLYGKYNITFNCFNEGEPAPFKTEVVENLSTGETVTPPTFPGKKLADGQQASYTVGNADASYDVYYTASTYDYTVAINAGNPWGTVMTTNAVPEGTVVKINNNKVDDGDAVSYSAAVTETDVQVTFPTGFEYMASSVDITGAAITVTCYDPRWKINFSKDQKYIEANRFIDNVRIGNKTFAITNDGLNTPAYRDFTNEVLVVPAGATLVPAIGYTGQWMHGFFYVDLNNDGTFYVQKPDTTTAASTEPNGELLSYKNQGNVLTSNNQTLPAFTMPTTPGDYRARFKMDWTSTDPGGNPGADINNVNSNNHIIANRGTIVDITLRIVGAVDVTYVVVDGNNNELFRTTETAGIGETITTLPEAYQHSLFYEYSTVNETISGNTTLTFTATPKADAPFQFTADTSAPVWYYLKNQGNSSNPNGAYPTYVEGGDPNVTLPTANAENATTSWAFIGNPYSGFQIVNEAAGTSLVLGSAAAGNNDSNGGDTYATLAAPNSEPERREVWTIEASSYATNGFFIRNADGHALNLRNNANLAYWTGGADQGSTFVATKVPSAEEKYLALIVQLQNILFGKGVNQYSLTVEGEDKTEEADKLIDALMKAGYTSDNMVEAKKLFDGASLNMPKPGFYRIKGEASQKYLTASMAENGKFAMTDATDNTTIFCFTAANGSEDAKLVNYPTGKAASVSGWTWIETGIANANKVEFQDGLTNGGYAIKFAAVHLYDKGNEGSADRGGNLTINSTTDPGYTCWKLEEVTELPITLKEVGGTFYATFSAPVDIASITGADAFDVEVNADNKKASTKAIAGIGLKAGNGVVLIGTSASATATIGAADETATTSLKPQYATEPAAGHNEAGHFFLGTKKNSESVPVIGFYMLKSDGGKTGGFKAYIEKNAAIGEAKEGFDLMFGETTAIENIENGAFENGAVYNLQGQRVGKAQKGVYIQNGKKVVLK